VLRWDRRREQHQVIRNVVSQEARVLLAQNRVRTSGEAVDKRLPHPSLDGDPSLLLGTWLPTKDAHQGDGSADCPTTQNVV
jgi:hypothetical protein